MVRKMKTMDGNSAAAHVSYAFTDLAAIYPITPSSNMAESVDNWAAADRRNIFGEQVKVVEMQSEAGAAGAVHGSLQGGALTTTFTASQGLLLMIPNLYKMAGELLPAVIHVSARTIAAHALSIFGDHSDIYACRQTGVAMLASTNPQEVMDLGAVAHLSAIDGSIPFMHFFDGFRTSHEIQKIQTWDYADLDEMVDHDAIQRFRDNALNPNHPVQRGTAQNADVFFQAREACNKYYEVLPEVVEKNMAKVNEKIGTDYKLFNYYGAPDAEHVIISMGSVNDTIEETIDYMLAKGEKVGLVKVRLYRPFSKLHLIDSIPKTVKTITVIDRTKEPGSIGEPLYLDVALALRGSDFAKTPLFAGRYGLASKDTTPANVISIYRNAENNGKERFTVGINDDVTYTSLEITENPHTMPEGTTACKFWGLGADGTVGANKNSIKIIGDNTDLYAQAYFSYDSKKSGGVTISHLRFGTSPIKSTYLINKADFVACHNPSYIDKYDMVSDLKENGVFLLNCSWNKDELESKLPNYMKKFLAVNKINLYTIDGIAIGKEIGLGHRINTVLQSAFFKLSSIIPESEAIDLMKKAATATYGRKGESIVKMNHDAIERGAKDVVKVEIPAEWANLEGEYTIPRAEGTSDVANYVNNVQIPVNYQKGDSLPVSTFVKDADGTVPFGSSAYEKRGIAVDVPCWESENCIQCNFCSYVCPHSVIRPVVLNEEEAKSAPKDMKLMDMTGMAGYKFGMTISTLDCTGCGSCVSVCPGKKGNKALVMQSIDSQMPEQDIYTYGQSVSTKPEIHEKFKPTTVKGSQFKQPLLEFSGACAGCGETPYAKLITQLYGDRMYIANATGCSSIWAGSNPSTPYTTNKEGQGPAWGNSLFEDNAEFGYGIYLAQKTIREALIRKVEVIATTTEREDVKAACKKYLETKNNGELNKAASEELVKVIETCDCKCGNGKDIIAKKDFLAKKSMWIFGGDGWAYDIGFGGLDHVIASGEDVNIFVFDTEIYSNTGGQSSKATPLGAVAQFAASGKDIKNKDLAAIAMSYGYVYVAQVSMGADYNQCIKAITEAESYDGPSIIISYAPCISHGIKSGMGSVQAVMKNAVTSGYWHLFRFDPRNTLEGKNPFTFDSKAPTMEYSDFINNEVRYTSLKLSFPERAKELFAKAEDNAKEKYNHLVRLSNLYNIEK